MKMFKRGKTIFGLDDLVKIIKKGEWIFYRSRPIHPEVINNMTLKTVVGGIKVGNFAVAIRKEAVE